MKKILVAGVVAAATMSAFPIAGAFAIQDELTVNIGSSCELTRTNGTGSYTKTMQLNALDAEFGTSTYKVVCNNGKGFYVSAAFSDLDDSGPGDNITYSATTPIAGSGTWTSTVTSDTSLGGAFTEHNIDPSSEDPAAKNLMNYNNVTPSDGFTATVLYKVSTRNNQAQGSYKGTASYVLNQNS